MNEMEYGREADEVIGLAFEGGFNSELRRQRVANFLRELVAASHAGCTGYGVSLASPESDPPASSSWRAARGAVPRPPGSPRAEDAIRRGRDVLEGATDAEVDGFLDALRPEAREPRHWGVRNRWSQPPLDPWPDGGIVIDPADPGSTSRPDVTSGEPEAEEGKES